jgi:AraC family transcriptional regulator
VADSFAPGSFYGAGEPLTFAGAVFTEVVHERARVTPKHSHDVAHFSLLLDGSALECAGRTTLECAPMTMVYRAAGLTHHDEIRDCGARYFILELGERWDDAIAACGDVPEHLHELRGGDPVWLALRLHRLTRSAEPSALDVDSLLYELCARTATMRPEDAREPAWVKRVVRTLDDGFRERLDLATLAADAGVHPAHLARTFRRFRGRTVGDYVTGMRVREACDRLLRGVPADEIAHDAGFADQSHMTRIFKAVTGMTPGEYRRTRR